MEVWHAAEELLEGDACFEAGEGRTHAEMGAVAERKVPVGGAVNVETVGVGELALVEICCPPYEQSSGVARDHLVVQDDVACRLTSAGLGWWLEAQHLLDGGRQQRQVDDELGTLVG